jgi:2-methylcitrate dehydratase PrpD
MGATRDIAEFAVKTRFEDLPAEVVHEAKRDIINVLAVSLYSARDPSLQYLLSMFNEEGSRPRATWRTTTTRTSPPSSIPPRRRCRPPSPSPRTAALPAAT